MDKKILIAYYSWSGNTEDVALGIQSVVGGELFEVLPEVDYPTKYGETVDRAKREINDGFKPKLARDIDVSNYDVIFVGTPNWWSAIAPPIATFLSEHNFTGKTVVPFSTHGGGGIARTASDMYKLCSGANVLEGFTTYSDGGNKLHDELKDWIKSLSL